LSHDGGVRRYGRAEEAEEVQRGIMGAGPDDVQIPFPGACIRPMVALQIVRDRGGRARRHALILVGLCLDGAQRDVAAMTRVLRVTCGL
jgi:hypothetical protein